MRVGSFVISGTLALVGAAAPAPGQQQVAAEESFEARIMALDPTAALNGPQAAIENGKALLAQAESEDLSPRAISHLNRYLAEGYFFERDFPAALPLFEEARRMLVDGGLGESDEAELFGDRIASTLSSMGRLGDALALQEAALPRKLARHGRVSDLYSAGLYSAALTTYRSGDLAKAGQMIAEAWDIRKQLPVPDEGPDPNVAIYGMSLASVLHRVGRNQEGLVAARESALWAEEHLGPGHIVTPAALQNFGGLLNEVGQFAEAEPIFRRTLAIREELIGRDHPDIAITLNGLAFSLQNLGRLREAEDLMLASADLYVARPDSSAPESAGLVTLNASNITAERGEAELAYARRQRAAELLADLEVPEDQLAWAQVYWGLGDSLLQRGEYEAAVGELRKSAAIFAAKAEPQAALRVRSEMALAEALLASGRSEEALAVGEAAYLAARGQLADSAAIDEDFVRNEVGYSRSFAQFAALALRSGRIEQGIEALQLARFGDLDRSARALAIRAAAGNAQARTLVRELQDAGARVATLRGAESAALASGDGEALAEARAGLDEAGTALARMRGELEVAYPGFADLSPIAPVALAGIRASLAADEAVLFVQPVGGGLLSLAITRSDLAWDTTQAPGRTLVDAVQAMRDAVDAGPDSTFPVAAGNAFYRAAFTPRIEAALADVAALKVMPGGYAAAIPFAMLPSSGSVDAPAWLLERFAISTPLSLDPAVGGRGGSGARDDTIRLAGFGDPRLAPATSAGSLLALLRGTAVELSDIRELPSLPGTSAELAAIAGAVGGSDPLLLMGEGLTEETVKAADLSGYDLLVFATHGLVSGELNGLREPALVLTPPARGEMADDDGLLTASEIAELRLDADWVILSACNTAAGEHVGAPSYSGLARAFVHAGARGLMLSHWRVRDDAAARLTIDTVKGAAGGLSRAEALRRAQLALMADRSVPGATHPAVWAPFVLVAD